jgi:hypothetical protein
MNGWGERLYLLMSGEMNLDITSAPPPVPAGTMNSTGFDGSHAPAVPIEKAIRTREKMIAAPILQTKNRFFIIQLPLFSFLYLQSIIVTLVPEDSLYGSDKNNEREGDRFEGMSWECRRQKPSVGSFFRKRIRERSPAAVCSTLLAVKERSEPVTPAQRYF